jgi:hypothetical protein
MDTSGIIFLAVSASISFGLGRLVMYLRARKHKAREEQAEQALRNLPAEPESRNKAKRKRQKRQSQRGEDVDDPSQ